MSLTFGSVLKSIPLKLISSLNLLFLCSICLFGQSEEDQVRTHIQAYLQGTSYTYPDQLTEIFSPEANLYVPSNEGGLRTIPIPEYIGFFKKEQEGQFTGRSGRIETVAIHGSLAYAKVAIDVPDGGFRFIDMFLLMKLQDGWTIISKAAIREPYTPSSLAPEVQKEIDQLLTDFKGPENPGATIAVLRNNELIFQQAYGMANLEYGTPMDDQTLVAIGSVSKHFTTFALLLLEERGLLSMDDDIRDHLPDLPDYKHPISLREIAWHTSGIRSNLELLGLQGYGPDDALSANFVRQLVYDQSSLNFSPGEDWSYSNSGYFLLADVVSQVSGQEFSSFMQQEIFAPLGMDHTFVMDNYEEVLNKRSYSYYGLQDGTYINAIMNRSSIGSTGIWTTMEDFIKWGQNFSTKELGSEALFAAMAEEGKLNNGRGIEYGLGLSIGTHLGSPIIHHGGGTSGFRAQLSHFPEQNMTLLLLSNHGNFNGDAIGRSIADLLYPEAAANSAAAETELQAAKLNTRDLEQYVGNYIHTRHHYSREISLRNDSLFIQYPWGASLITPLENGRLYVQEHDYEMVIEERNGQMQMQTLTNGIVSGTYETFQIQDLESSDLEEYAGFYFSEELNVIYELRQEEEQLIIHHSRIGDISLSAYKQDHFIGNSWRLNGLQFERSDATKISGFHVSTNRNQGMYFRRISF